MLLTVLPQQPLSRPAACLWNDQLVVAWRDGNRNGAITLGIGPALTAGQFTPTIVPLQLIAQGEIAIATMRNQLWLAFPSGGGELSIASSVDGRTFSPPIIIASDTQPAVSLASGAFEQNLLVGWAAADPQRHILVGLLDEDVTFVAGPAEINVSTFGAPSLSVLNHPYHGELAIVCFESGATVHAAMASSDAPSQLNGNIQDLRLAVRSGFSSCSVTPPDAPDLGLAIATLYGSSMALTFRNADLRPSGFPDTTGATSDTVPALVSASGDLLMVIKVNTEIKVGSWDSVFGMPPDIRKKIGTQCDPRKCPGDPRLVCVLTGDQKLVQQQAMISNARKGDLLLSPADGSGVIGTILKSLAPVEFYDHMGIMLEDCEVVRHCTESKERLMSDKNYYTGSLFGSPAPTDGLRPDMVKYGWPGAITQSVQNALFDGWNDGRNPEWNYHGLAHALETGTVLSEEQKRAFFDLEFPENPVRITNMTWAPTYRDDHKGPLQLLVVRSPRGSDEEFGWLPWARDRVVAEADQIVAHYRFFAYTDALTATNAAQDAPPKGDTSWRGLPAGADWAAGTHGMVCSTFVWFAARKAFAGIFPFLRLDMDPLKPTDGTARAQPPDNAIDGLYIYTADERTKASKGLHDFVVQTVQTQVKQIVDKNFPTLGRIGVGVLVGVLTGTIGEPLAGAVDSALEAAGAASPEILASMIEAFTSMAEHVANGVCNAFANDRPEDRSVDARAWEEPGVGLSVSPDDVMLYWDAPADVNGEILTGLWGSVEQAMLVNPRPELVDVGVIALSPGIAVVIGCVQFRGEIVVGAEVFVGCYKTVTTPDGLFFISVPASPPSNNVQREQLIRAQMYSAQPPGMLRGQLKKILEVGRNSFVSDPIVLQAPPEWRRRVEIHGHLDMIHQVLFGHNTTDHPPVSASVFVQVDPQMDDPRFATAAEAARTGTFDFKTDRCGGERAHLFGRISMFDPNGPQPPEGPNAVRVDWVYEMLDGDDDRETTVDSQNGHLVIAAGGIGHLTPALNDGDEPPDRAASDIIVENNPNPA